MPKKLWFKWSEEEFERHNSKRHQIFVREVYRGLADRTKKENEEKLKKFKDEFANVIKYR